MTTLPHHVEFLSDAWLAEARKFLDRTAPRMMALAGQPFSVSERFTSAPPHLGFDDNVAAWSVHFDGSTVSVSRDFNPDADVVIEGRYQANLLMAQTVGALDNDVMKSAYKEMAQHYGKEAVAVRGKLTNSGAVELMALLHDHLARRTLENPDIAHRAHQQGLIGHIREMNEQGYTVIERAITPEFADQVREATVRTLLPHNSFQLQWMLYHGAEFERIVQNPLLMTLIDASLGRGAGIASISAIRKGPGDGVIPLHTDYSLVPEPFPDFAMTGVGVWSLEDWTVASGPTWIVPGSHRYRRQPRPEDKPEGIPIEMPKGSVVYFTSGVWHWQGDRTEAGDRVTLHSHFNRGILRGLEPKRVDVQMMHRNPPRLGEMLGEDDWFDKIGPHGRDHVRASYMNKLHAFTNQQLATILAPDLAEDVAQSS